MERAEYHRPSRARMAETAKDASGRATPDAPERIDHRRRRTRHDHRTCCRGSRGSASLPCHTLRKRVEICHAGLRGSASLPFLRFVRPPTKSSPGQRILVDCAILHDDQKVFVGVFDEFDIFQGIAIDQQ